MTASDVDICDLIDARKEDDSWYEPGPWLGMALDAAAELRQTRKELAAAQEQLVHMRCDTGETWEDECMRTRKERDEARAGYTRLDVNWSRIHKMAIDDWDNAVRLPGSTIAEKVAAVHALRSDLAAAVKLLERHLRYSHSESVHDDTRAFLDALAKRGGT